VWVVLVFWGFWVCERKCYIISWFCFVMKIKEMAEDVRLRWG